MLYTYIYIPHQHTHTYVKVPLAAFPSPRFTDHLVGVMPTSCNIGITRSVAICARIYIYIYITVYDVRICAQVCLIVNESLSGIRAFAYVIVFKFMYTLYILIFSTYYRVVDSFLLRD